MNGNVVKQWKEIGIERDPVKLLPGGYVMGPTGRRGFIFDDEDSNDLSVVDWDGNIIWSFPKAGMHHDHQREPNPVGYYVPGMDPYVNKGKTLILSNEDVIYNEVIIFKDFIFVTDYNGNIIFRWLLSDHVDQLLDYIKNDVCWDVELALETMEDPLNIHSASWVGADKWYAQGDERFHPDNIILGLNLAGISIVVDRNTGDIVWMSPTIDGIGLHAHVIQKGLTGEGNVLAVQAMRGCGTYDLEGYSRVVEMVPITGQIVWEYNALKADYADASRFYTSNNRRFEYYRKNAGGAQRLPNGNTLITESAYGRLFEVTPDHETVWEYVSPFYNMDDVRNHVYRAFRYPYDYIPQLKKPKEEAVIPPDNSRIRLDDLKIKKIKKEK